MSKKRGTTGFDLTIGQREISGEIGVGDVAFLFGVVQQADDLFVRIAAEDTERVIYVSFFHADDKVIEGVIAFFKARGALPREGNSVFSQLGDCRWVDGVALFFVTGRA